MARPLISILICAVPLFGADSALNLLPTDVLKKQIQTIEARLVQYQNARDGRNDFRRLRELVTDFVVAQLDAEPRLDADHLRKQLVRLSLMCAREPVCPELPFTVRKPLDAFTLPPGPATWGVVYEAPLHFGWDGNRIVVESYVVDLQGKAHPAGRGGYEMNGFALNAFDVPNRSQGSLSILVWGMKLWSSGHALPGKATLYSLGPSGVDAIWQTPVLHSVEAAPVPLGPDAFMLQYHDEDRCAQRLPDRAVDTYRVTEAGLRRVGHQYW